MASFVVKTINSINTTDGNYLTFDNQTMIIQIVVANEAAQSNTVTIKLTDSNDNVRASLYLLLLDAENTFSDTCKIVIPAGYKLFIQSVLPSVSIYLAGVEV